MTQYAPVAPLASLHELVKAGLLGRYQLLIAPMVLHNPDGYGHFFDDHDDQTIILDNGVIELGHAVSPQALAEAAKIVRADVVVMPDTIDDAAMTMKQVRYNLEAFRLYDTTSDTMGVVQGMTFEECLVCAKSHVDAGVDWLAVPRGLTPHLGTRVPLVEHLASEYGKPIHVLGFSDNIKDDIEAATCHRLVVGIDAATPMWLTQYLPVLPPADPMTSFQWGRRPVGFWQLPLDDNYALRNVETVRNWLHDATTARIAREGLARPVAPQTHHS